MPTQQEESNLVHDSGKHGTALVNTHFTPDRAKESAEYIRSVRDISPKIAIVCGSGCDPIGELISDGKSISYSKIPHFPVPTGVPGHKGTLVIGHIANKPVVCMLGRFHAYEGYSTASCTFPIRVLKCLGVEVLFNTAACGALNPDYNGGDTMIIKDHISLPALSLESPLVGRNHTEFGVRFPEMVRIYDPELREIVKSIVADLGAVKCLREGVYLNIGGPAFETVAEVLMLRSFGADAVGMSMTHETTVAHHSGMKVVALGIIADKAPDSYEHTRHTTEQEVIDQVHKSCDLLSKIVSKFVEQISF